MEKLMNTIFKVQILIMLVMLAGWVQSIVKLTKCDFKPSYKAEVVYAIGCIPPVGMIVGWMNIEDTPVTVD